MNKDNLELCSKLMGGKYVSQGEGNRRCLEKKIHHLLEQRKLPDSGWSDIDIRHFIGELSIMDSNNFTNRVGVGEREGRVLNALVAERHFNLAHGIGRSGDIAALQPKAVGSSLISKLANSLVLDVIKLAGVHSVSAAAIIPTATGMTLTLCFLYLKKENPLGKYVIWPRIDQKSCFKSMLTAGLTPIIVEPVLVGDELQTNLEEIERLMELHGNEVLAVMCTTSCFAPRVCDRIVDVAVLCKAKGIAHVVNNAYGVQGKRCMNLIQKGHEMGRIDVFVQSTDKNFLVPVGGAVIASADPKIVDNICKTYPGRASITPSLDVMITLLSLGRKGFEQLLKTQKECLQHLRTKIASLAELYGERLMVTNGNPISLAMTLTKYPDNPTELGAMLFTRSCSGARVVVPTETKDIDGYIFKNFGSHSATSTTPYLNCAAGIGQSTEEIDVFVEKLKTILQKKHSTNKS